ncbi:Ni/Fe hydrogenase subunit alpha, partial [bacterium]|nr:Ni/Fe hydrogenase subunit alpha [bacterium]
MIELLHALEVIADLLDNPALLSGDLLTSGTRRRSGVGIIEAPRGTLIHDYDVGDDDLVTRCNLI